MEDQFIPDERSPQYWGQMTNGWKRWNDKFSKQSAEATRAIIELAQINEGMRVLDLACGSGEPSLSIARTFGPTGHVVATDIVPGMLESAEATARSRHISNIEFRHVDAETIPFPDGTFDAVTCRFGVMFFSDPERAMREARRVLKNRGFVALVSWGPLKYNPRYTTTISIVEKYLQSAPKHAGSRPSEDNIFKFADHGSLSRILSEAEFIEITERHLKIPWVWDGTAKEQFESFSDMSAPFRKMRSTLDQDSQRRATNEILSAIGKYYDGQGVNFTAVINTAVGRKIDDK
ncbi:MAG: methyltransferase domain-containing protein [Nitrososphaerales archaeon]